ACTASGHAKAPIGHTPLSPALCLDLRSRSCCQRRLSPTACVGCSAPAPGSHSTTRRVEPALCRGRYEGTEKFLGRRALTAAFLHSSPKRRVHLKTCVVQSRKGCAVIRKSRQNTRPSADCARIRKAKKKAKNRSQGSVSLDTWGPHTCWA